MNRTPTSISIFARMTRALKALERKDWLAIVLLTLADLAWNTIPKVGPFIWLCTVCGIVLAVVCIASTKAKIESA